MLDFDYLLLTNIKHYHKCLTKFAYLCFKFAWIIFLNGGTVIVHWNGDFWRDNSDSFNHIVEI